MQRDEFKQKIYKHTRTQAYTVETSSVWNPLGQRTRSEEQILFLKFSGANVGGHGRLSKGANILERIKLSRIGLANVFSQTVSMRVFIY